MRYSNETFSEWSSKGSEEEIELAKAKIRKGQNAEEILEEFSKRVTKKLLHPVLERLQSNFEFDAERSRKEYEEIYIKKVGRAADHVSDD